ncbi:MAG: hypothetical protein V8Q39_00105 [Anaerovoracaceae bacterium]
MRWYEKIIAAHTAVTDAVSHDVHMQSDRYFVWGERGRNDFEADGIHEEKAILGYTDLYSKQEFEPWRDEIERQFDAAEISWALNSVQFEEETGFTHVEWYWEVFDDGES